MKRRLLGKWEPGCVVYHLCVCKAFTEMPTVFGRISGSAAYLTAAFSGAVMLGLLFLLLTVQKRFPTQCSRIFRSMPIRFVTAVFWLAAAGAAIWKAADILMQVEYFSSPVWYLMLFLIGAAVVTVLCGGAAVYRMHALLVLPVALVLVTVLCSGIPKADINCLTPFFGNGADTVFGQGFSALPVYADLLFLFPLFDGEIRKGVPVRSTVMIAAGLGVLTNVAVTLMATLSVPYVMQSADGIPMYLMSDFVFGIETVYLAAFSASAMLYPSLGIYGAWRSLKGISLRRKAKPAVAALLCVALCGGLCGCYDAGEVEESAYVIGLGIDSGREARYRFTFQLSNPLSSAEEVKPETEEKNKTVIHYCEEGENFYTAVQQLRSHLGKNPELSQLTLIAFSVALAKEDIGEEAEQLLRDRQIRPDTNLCLTDSAEMFLKQVMPRLEESTAKYYDLLFRQQTSPFAPTTDLREFVSKMQDSGIDAVLPIANGDRLYGMGLFHRGRLTARLDAKEASTYLLLAGKGKQMTYTVGNTVFSVSADAPARIEVDKPGGTITVTCAASVQLEKGSLEKLPALEDLLQRETSRFLQQAMAAQSDAVGLGRAIRKGFRTRAEWERFQRNRPLAEFEISTKTDIRAEKKL